MNKKFTVISLAGALLLGGAVAAGAADTNGEGSTWSKKETGQDLITVEEAKKIALSEAEGRVESIELERANGKQYYEIDIENGREDFDIKVHALDGEVISINKERNDDDDNDQSEKEVNGENVISEQKAIEIAEKEVNGTMKEIDIDEDNGQILYEVELQTNKGEADVDIDAETGKVLKVELDD
ncbi:putative membrane protein YkoI [Cytobacillus firmus]|uniref:Putative membrane protein YkoI n=2 Tax=Cytobacillus TaxID=2675230 RepID=A0A366JTV1_CYTFI|nr:MULTISPECIES: PepSY domain-containing protein [Cytobacillus]RBP92397.1 putative membrane protein YkoI [Cytobacillus firmus]TDX41918.1 putative membrane protein YkoI [Cytobacillus oceanisediminis]